MKRALSVPILCGFFLAACGQQNTEAPVASVSPSASSAPAKPSVQRKTTPAALREADEKACASGTVEACRRMADRYRGYGHVAGCGIERSVVERVYGRVIAPMSVRLKRVIDDEHDDETAFLTWIGKACDLGDTNACTIERVVRGKGESTSELDIEAAATRGDPSSSAFIAFHALWQPEAHAKFMERRKACLSGKRDECLGISQALVTLAKEETRRELTPDLVTKLQAICDQTLDCGTVLMMLDRHGYPPDALAPIVSHASKALVQACAEGSCVCGEAARHLPPDDPRVPDLARFGCENGEASGCYILGKLHEEGRGVEKDEVFARSLYELACPPARTTHSSFKGDFEPLACSRLAELAEGGALPPKNRDRAVYYAQYACLSPGYARDHAPCVKLARYWANGVLKSVCGSYDGEYCRNSVDYAEELFYGPKYPPADGKECQRPSVKALCDAHEAEIVAMRKPDEKKKKK
jgi:hypothetical protein